MRDQQTATLPPGAEKAGSKLPIWATLRESLRLVFFDHLRNLPRVAFLPLLVLLIIVIAERSLHSTLDYRHADSWILSRSFTWISWALQQIPTVIFATAWLALLMAGPGNERPRLLPSWHARNWRFLGYLLLWGLASALALLALSRLLGLLHHWSAAHDLLLQLMQSTPGMILFDYLPTLVFAVTFGWLAARLCLVLPAAAADLRYGLPQSWRHTRGQGFRIVAILAVLYAGHEWLLWEVPPLTAWIHGWIGTGLAAQDWGPGLDPRPALNAISAAIEIIARLFTIALVMTVIFLAFRACSNQHSAAESSSREPPALPT